MPKIPKTNDETPEDWNTVISVDMNSRVGKQKEDPIKEDLPQISLGGKRRVIGKYGYGERNENGEGSIQCLPENGFVALNTIYQRPNKHKTTWKTKVQIENVRERYISAKCLILNRHVNTI